MGWVGDILCIVGHKAASPDGNINPVEEPKMSPDSTKLGGGGHAGGGGGTALQWFIALLNIKIIWAALGMINTWPCPD